LFLKKVIDGIQEKRDSQKTDIRFVPGDQNMGMETFRAIDEISRELAPKRTLLVTEYVETGETIKEFVHILRLIKMKFDIAILSGDKYGIENIEEETANTPDARIYYGDIGVVGLNKFHRASGLSGVVKIIRHGNQPSVLKKAIPPNYPEEDKKGMQQRINQARKDIELLAEETLGELNSYI
jgi:hypothetical protein